MLLVSELQELKVDSKFIGVSYVANGKTLEGTDCSGLVRLFLEENGVSNPIDSQDSQEIIKYFFYKGSFVEKEDLKPLDIILFKINQDVYHVGVYIGYGKFLPKPLLHDFFILSEAFFLNSSDFFLPL